VPGPSFEAPTILLATPAQNVPKGNRRSMSLVPNESMKRPEPGNLNLLTFLKHGAVGKEIAQDMGCSSWESKEKLCESRKE
jgi:hypothetical protein